MLLILTTSLIVIVKLKEISIQSGYPAVFYKGQLEK